ncbi:predicted protein [Plenodomus lingam JN3]|uniref:Predicted protein n=1 Tax=Leptosphaeria maculans (strain JN3 / isolate v23.1.3 / race Av1-4-5-6-7-8) TaxID=985895 RepID=E4ZMA9_LEPMJ|nr:predicted protein [Plenodomus lingam JN3]CBX92458.1 predicted protein [Plenodomus lingam JN3]
MQTLDRYLAGKEKDSCITDVRKAASNSQQPLTHVASTGMLATFTAGPRGARTFTLGPLWGPLWTPLGSQSTRQANTNKIQSSPSYWCIPQRPTRTQFSTALYSVVDSSSASSHVRSPAAQAPDGPAPPFCANESSPLLAFTISTATARSMLTMTPNLTISISAPAQPQHESTNSPFPYPPCTQGFRSSPATLGSLLACFTRVILDRGSPSECQGDKSCIHRSPTQRAHIVLDAGSRTVGIVCKEPRALKPESAVALDPAAVHEATVSLSPQHGIRPFLTLLFLHLQTGRAWLYYIEDPEDPEYRQSVPVRHHRANPSFYLASLVHYQPAPLIVSMWTVLESGTAPH